MVKSQSQLLGIQFPEVSDIIVSVEAGLELFDFCLQLLSHLPTQLTGQLEKRERGRENFSHWWCGYCSPWPELCL